jgi:hypothetical protein
MVANSNTAHRNTAHRNTQHSSLRVRWTSFGTIVNYFFKPFNNEVLNIILLSDHLMFLPSISSTFSQQRGQPKECRQQSIIYVIYRIITLNFRCSFNESKCTRDSRIWWKLHTLRKNVSIRTAKTHMSSRRPQAQAFPIGEAANPGPCAINLSALIAQAGLAPTK